MTEYGTRHIQTIVLAEPYNALLFLFLQTQTINAVIQNSLHHISLSLPEKKKKFTRKPDILFWSWAGMHIKLSCLSHIETHYLTLVQHREREREKACVQMN